ncbi:MAG: hypothetical protein H6741_21865 [Alphaproteobacteria bacterium]|nr:hypothetical protein [Alphaproteobacteria bacterium]MCB9795360.1 hypothetical protein [Alphaproteobacteria bacterium]
MFALLTLSLAWGHELRETTARVELRGDHVTVSVNVDVGGWLSALSQDPRPLGVIAITDTAALEGILSAADQELSETHLRVGEAELPLRVLDALDVEETRRAIIRNTHESMTGPHAHLPRAQLTLEGRLPPEAESLSLQLPASMGPVVLSFSEPRSATARAGEAAEFVLKEAHPTSPPGASWVLAALTGLLGFVFGWRLSGPRRGVS